MTSLTITPVLALGTLLTWGNVRAEGKPDKAGWIAVRFVRADSPDELIGSPDEPGAVDKYLILVDGRVQTPVYEFDPAAPVGPPDMKIGLEREAAKEAEEGQDEIDGEIAAEQGKSAPWTKHVINPGEHVFETRGKEIRTRDPCLKVTRNGLDVLCQPVRIVGVRAPYHPTSPRLQASRLLAVAGNFRYGNLPGFRFESSGEGSVIYLVPNAKGDIYEVNLGHVHENPYHRFRVTERGVELFPASDSGPIYARGHTIIVPSYSFPRSGGIPGRQISVSGGYATDGALHFFPRGEHEAPRWRNVNVSLSTYSQEVRTSLGVFDDFERMPVRRFAFVGHVEEARGLWADLLGLDLSSDTWQPGKALTARVCARAPKGPDPRPSFALRRTRSSRSDSDGDWDALAFQDAGQSLWTLRAPDKLVPGIYSLRLTIGEGLPGIEQSLLIPEGKNGRLSVFTATNREVFQCGENVPFTACLWAERPIEPASVSFTLTNERGSRLPPAQHSLPALDGGSGSFHFMLDTFPLSPGRWTLEAACGALGSQMRFDLVAAEPPTRFKLGFFAYPHGFSKCFFGDRGAADYYGGDVAAYIKAMAQRCGLNLVMINRQRRYGEWMGSYLRRDHAQLAGLAAFCAERPEAGSQECFYSPNTFERLFDEALRQGIDILDCPSTTFAERCAPAVLDEERESSQTEMSLVAQAFRRFPAFKGVAYTHDSQIQTSPLACGNEAAAKHNNAINDQFTAKGNTIPDGRLLAEYKRRCDVDPNYEDAAFRKQWLTWVDYILSLIPASYSDSNATMKAICPRAVSASWHQQVKERIAYGAVFPWINETLDIGSFSMYNEFARVCPLVNQYGVDAVRPLGRPIWAGLDARHYGGVAPFRKEAFLCMARGVQGVGTGSSGALLADGTFSAESNQDGMRQFSDLIRPFGDLFAALQPKKEIAILYSYSQQKFDDHHFARVAAAYLKCFRADRPAQIVLEDTVRSGGLSGSKLLLLVGLHRYSGFPSGELRAKLEAFQKDGGIILCDEETNVAIGGMRRIDTDFRDFYPHGCYLGHELDYRRLRPKVALLDNLLEPFLPKPFATPSDQVHASCLDGEGIDYLFVVNEKQPFPDWDHTDHVIPTREPVALRSVPPAVYEVFSHQRVQPQEGAILADLSHIEARVFALLPSHIGGLRMTCPRELKTGQACQVATQLLGGQQEAIAGIFPVAYRVSRPDGSERLSVYRVGGKAPERVFVPALDDPPGEWALAATEQISGHTATARFTLVPSTADVIAPRPEVIVQDGSAISRFLGRRREAAIILDGADAEQLLPIAESLKSWLGQKGIRAEVANFAAAPAWRITGDSLVLGTVGAHRALVRPNELALLWERLSPNFPGPGRGLLAHLWSVYRPGRDAVLCVGGDAAGARRAAEALMTLGAGEAPVPLASAEGVKETPQETTIGTRRVELPAAEIRQGAPAVAIAVSPDGEKTAVGLWSYGYNLMLLDRTGQLLWKRKLGRTAVTRVWFTADGKYLGAYGFDGEMNQTVWAENRFCARFRGNENEVAFFDLVGNPRSRFFADAPSVSADGRHVLVRLSGQLVVFDADGDRREIDWPTTGLDDVSLSPDGRRALLRRNKLFTVCDLQTGRSLWDGELPVSVLIERDVDTKERRRHPDNWAWTSFLPDNSVAIVHRGELDRTWEGPAEAIHLDADGNVLTRTGMLNWFRANAKFGGNRYAILSRGQRFIFGRDAAITCVSAGGEQLWSASFPPRIDGLTVMPDGESFLLFLASGEVVLLSAEGQRLATFSAGPHSVVAMAGDKSLAVADASGNVGVLRPEGSFVYRTNLLEAAELEKAEALVRQAEKEREALRYPVPRLAPKKVSLRVTESDGIERRDEFVCIGLAALGIAEPFQSAEAQTEGGQALPAQIATTPERDRELLLLLANLEAKGTVSLSVTLRSERDTRGAEGVTLTDFYNHYSVQSGGLRAAFGVVSGEHFFGHFGRMMTLSYGSVSMGCDEFKLEGGSARPEGFRVETGPVAVRVWSRVLSSSLPGRMVLDRIYDCLLGGRIEERISISCTESFAKAPADRAMEKKTTAVIEAVETTGKEEEKDEADNAMKKETESRRLTVKKEALIEEIIKTVGFSRTDTVGGNAVSFRDKRKAPPTWCAVAGSDARSQILVFYPQSASELGGDIVDEQGRLRIGASFAAHETWSRTLRIVYASGDSPGTTDRDQFLQRLRRSLRCELAK